jgi:Tol biopolymer transport system component
MILSGGMRLGRFEVLGELGAGGMGEVYRARDPQLGRDVAIKILAADPPPTPERMLRLEREARALSAVRHPTIVPVFEFSEAHLPIRAEPVRFLVMELVEGERLSAAVAQRAGLQRLMQWMADVADGIAAAHDAGIVHCDLKPGNLMVTGGRWPRILDFGLARPAQPPSGTEITTSVSGTPDYMAPEQINGFPVDARSDVFAFGCTLFELVTGAPPFRRATRVDTLHAIAHDPPAALPPTVPAELSRIIRKCLSKLPADRYQSMRDVSTDLRELAAGAFRQTTRRRLGLRWGLAAVVAFILTALTVASWPRHDARPAAAEPAPVLSVERLTNSGRVIRTAISLDGKYLAYSERDTGGESIWVKHLPTGSITRIVGTPPMIVHQLSVPGDADWVYFVATIPPRDLSHVYRVPILGGTPETIVEDIDYVAFPEAGGKVGWIRFHAEIRDYVVGVTDAASRAETILMKVPSPQWLGVLSWRGERLTFLHRRDVASRRAPDLVELDPLTRSSRTLFTLPPELKLARMTWSRDGSEVLATGSRNSIVETRAGAGELWTLSMPGGEVRKLTVDVASYSGQTLTADGSVIAATRTETTSNLEVVDASNPLRRRSLTSGIGNLHAVSGDLQWLPGGEIVFCSVDQQRIVINTIAAEGGVLRPLRGVAAPQGQVTFSRDGSKLAYQKEEEQIETIWISDRTGANRRAVIRGEKIGPIDFFPDGRHLAICSFGNEQRIWKINVDTGARTLLTSQAANTPQIAPDGRSLLCQYRTEERDKLRWRAAIVPLEPQGPPRIFDFAPRGLRWHPDGKAFSFMAPANDIPNIWLQDARGGPPRQVTFYDSGRIVAYNWSPDGRSLVVARGNVVSDAVAIRRKSAAPAGP